MTDRELLELAAKAAGIEIKVVIGDTFWCPDGTMWDPLTNDADALRLAVDLGLVVEIGYAARGFVAVRTNTDNWQEFREAWGADPYAATRRAIVRAAAEIQRAKERSPRLSEMIEHNPDHSYLRRLDGCGHGRLWAEPCRECEIAGLLDQYRRAVRTAARVRDRLRVLGAPMPGNHSSAKARG